MNTALTYGVDALAAYAALGLLAIAINAAWQHAHPAPRTTDTTEEES